MESIKNIEQLLDAYFEGESTLPQETQLREYFTGGGVAPHLEKYIPLFSAFAEARKERYTGEINLPQKKKQPWLSIAASILVLVGLFLFFKNSNDTVKGDYGTYKDPQVAALKTKQALFMMGSFMGESTSQLSALDEFEKTTDKYINNNN
ncbi:MAG: hypothetical protein WA951_09515 [Leeuwenhoekiella sp.]